MSLPGAPTYFDLGSELHPRVKQFARVQDVPEIEKALAWQVFDLLGRWADAE
jgi:hypothetical protein